MTDVFTCGKEVPSFLFWLFVIQTLRRLLCEMTLKTLPDDAVGPVFREVTSSAVMFGQLHKTAVEVPSLLRFLTCSLK